MASYNITCETSKYVHISSAENISAIQKQSSKKTLFLFRIFAEKLFHYLFQTYVPKVVLPQRLYHSLKQTVI